MDETRWQDPHHACTGGDRCRAHTREIGHRSTCRRVRGEHLVGLESLATMVPVRGGHRRAEGSSQTGCRAGSLGRRRRIHSASTIAAASVIAGHTGSTTLVTPINTTSTSNTEMTCICRYKFVIPEPADVFKRSRHRSYALKAMVDNSIG